MSMDIKDLKELRIQLNISLREAAKWLKVSNGTIGTYERGQFQPSSDFLFNYEQFLQDVIDGKIKVKTSKNAGRIFKKEKMTRILEEETQVTIADILPAIPKKEAETPQTPITPKYYKSKNGIEAIDYIEAFNLNFNLGNVIKYVTRVGKKTENALEDLQKAQWYLEREIERRKCR